MLAGLSSQRPTLGSDALMDPRDLQLDLGNRLGQLGDLLPERSALRPLLLDAQEQIRSAQVRIGRHRNPVPQPATGTHNCGSCHDPPLPSDHPYRARPADPWSGTS
jgi:hypothetical protein